MKTFLTSLFIFLLCTGGLSGQNVQVDFSSTSGQVAPNGTIDVDVRVSDFNNLVTAQMAFLWDKDVLEIQSIPYLSATLSGFSEFNFALPSQTSDNAKGELRMAWFSNSLIGETLAADHLLFTMRLKAVGEACENTLFRAGNASNNIVEISDEIGTLYDLCTNTFVSQISGTACTHNSNLVCNDQVNISLDEQGEALLHPNIVLSGGPYDYTQVSVEPSKLTCADDGQTITYIATDAVSGNTCFGTILPEDKLGYCDGSSGGGNNENLACNAFVNVSLTPWGPTTITPEMVLDGNFYDYTQLSVNPSEVGCDDIGEVTCTVTAANGNSCWTILNVEDKAPPVAIAAEVVFISLTQAASGDPYSAKLFVENVDNGSYDNCTAQEDLLFEPAFYEFDCSHIGNNIVYMTVTDEYGNSNEVWTTVTVELKIEGEGTCPDDVVVDCTTDILDDTVIASTLGQAFVADGCPADYTDVPAYDENGDGDTNDDFVFQGITYSESYVEACNIGVISRAWNTEDENGEDCVQRIYVGHSGVTFSEDNITWPEDQRISCIDDVINEDPIIDDSAICSFIGFSVHSDVFNNAPDACSKIIKTYTVIDWCNYDPNTTSTSGLYEHTVVISIIDVTSPEVQVSDQEVSSCGAGGYRLSASVDDRNCRANDVTWNVSIDSNMDGSEDYMVEYTTDNLGTYFVNVPTSAVSGEGPHGVTWVVTDDCGNVQSVTSTFTIVTQSIDDKAPTLNCTSAVTVVVEPYSGSGPLPPPTVTYAKEIDAGSFDDCTASANLRFTFSDVAPANDPTYSSFERSSSMSFVQADLNGENTAILTRDMYVWDESNNSDFCRVNITLREGGGSTSGDLTLAFSDKFSSINDLVCMPLRVSGFNNINALQGTVSWDSDVLDYSSVQSMALPGMSESSFFYNEATEKLSYVWIDNSGLTPATLANGSTLFEVCYRVTGNTGDVSPVRLTNDPTPVVLSDNNGVVSATLIDGSVTVGEGPDCSVDLLAPVPICTSLGSAVTNGGLVELFAADFNSNSYDNCTPASQLRYTFSAVSPDSDPSYIASARSSSAIVNLQDANSDGEISLLMYVWDNNNNYNSCAVTVVLISDSNCIVTEDDIIFPPTFLTVPVTITNPNEVNNAFAPDALSQLSGIEEADVFPTYTMTGCSNLAQAYNDVIIEETGGAPFSYKIIREWTVIDWLTGNTYTSVQIIRNYGDEAEYICDTLPRSAPEGDCDSGHTLEDDVEWPNDIAISDHRLTPDELMTISGILQEDSRPIFYDDVTLYVTDYVDVINDLTQETLVIDREWSVTRTDLQGAEWNYTQKITVDLREFGMLVTVNTLNNRPVPDVTIDGVIATNDQGLAYTEESVDPYKDDIAYNGLNIRDIILMQAHKLAISQLDNLQLQAADINGDGAITNSDISAIRKVILGIDDQLSSEWTFVDQTNATTSGIDPKAHYVAIKPGDVDDSAVLTIEPDIDATETIYIEDILINEGASYSVPLYFGREINSLGAELHLDFDADALDIRSVSATDAFGEISWSLDGGNRIVILNYNDNGMSEVITTDTPILTIEFQAKQNGILKGLFSLSDNIESWIVTEDYGMLLIDGVFTGEIGVGIEDINNDLGIRVFPNPASDFVTIDRSIIESTSDMRVQLYDVTGQLVLSTKNSSTIKVSDMISGMYIYKLTIDDQVQTGKLLVKK